MPTQGTTTYGKRLWWREGIVLLGQLFILLRLDNYILGTRLEGRPVTPFQSFVLLFLLYAGIWMMTVPRPLKARIINKCAWIIFPIVVLVMLELLSTFNLFANYTRGGRWLYYPIYQLMIFLMGFLVAEMNFSKTLMRVGMKIALLVFCATVFMDVVHPGTFSTLLYRPAGLGVTPTISSELIIMFLILSLNWNKPVLLDAILYIVAFAAEFATLSRQGIVQYIVVIILYLFFHRKEKGRLLLHVFTPILFLLIAIASILPELMAHTAFFSYSSNRLSAFLGHDTSSFFGKGNGRFDAIRIALNLITQRPILGYGIGYVSTMQLEPHDEYLAEWIELGVLGFVAYLWFLASMLWHNWKNRNSPGIAMSICFIILGVFSHNILEDKTMILMAVYATAFYGPRSVNCNQFKGREVIEDYEFIE